MSGSSSFEIIQRTGEPLTGRKVTFELLPFSEVELWETDAAQKRIELLRKRMVFGNYPEVYLDQSNASRVELCERINFVELFAFGSSVPRSFASFRFTKYLTILTSDWPLGWESKRKLNMSGHTLYITGCILMPGSPSSL